MENYRVSVITSLSEMNAVRQLWEAVQWHPDADFDLFSMVVHVRDNVISPCIFVLSRNDEPVALLAGRIEKGKIRIRFGYAPLVEISNRQIVFVAGGFMGDETDANWKRLLTAVDSLLRKQKLDLAIFEHLKIGFSEYDTIRQTFKRAKLSCYVQEEANHRLLRLPATFDGFMANRSQKHRYWLKRLHRVLDREFNKQWRIQRYCLPIESRKFVEDADSVARMTYQRRLGTGFRWDKEAELRVDLDAQRGRLRGYVLFIKDEPKAFWYCSVYNHTLYLEATAYDPDYRSYELGTILLMKVFEDHCGTDIEIVDFGLGDADYKKRFCSDSFKEKSVFLFSMSPRGMYLQCLHNATNFSNKIAKNYLDRLKLLQRVKTHWRRRLERSLTTTGFV